jgi:hypothetical protein
MQTFPFDKTLIDRLLNKDLKSLIGSICYLCYKEWKYGHNLRRLIKMHALEIPETLSPKNGPYIYLLIHTACLLLSR